MQINGTVKQVTVKAGKSHDVQFDLRLTDDQVVELIRLRNVDLTLHIEQTAFQLPMLEEAAPEVYIIDAVEYPLLRDEEGDVIPRTGAELREIAGLDSETCLHLVASIEDEQDPDLVGRPYETVPPEALIELEAGMAFTSHVGPEPEPEPGDEPEGEKVDGALPAMDSFPPRPERAGVNA